MYERELKRLKKEFGSFWEILSNYDAYIAGGAITSVFTNSDINDFDVYFSSEEELKNFVLDLNGGFTVVSHTDKATLLLIDNSKIQLIRFDYFKNTKDIFDKFDFTVCMGAYSFKDEQFYFHDDFFKHNSQRVLIFNPKTAYPYISMMRVKKYESKRYTISKPEFAKIMLTCCQKPINSYDEATEQLGGMYGTDFSSLISKIEDDKFTIETLIEKLSDLDVSDYNFDMPLNSCIDSSELVYAISKEKTDVYEAKNGSLAIIGKRIDVISKKIKDDFVNIIDVNEKFKVGDRLYKWVRETNVEGVFESHRDSNFKYKIGEIVTDNKKGLWVSMFDNKDELMYSKNKDTKFIELEIVEGCEFLSFNSDCVQATKLKVIG